MGNSTPHGTSVTRPHSSELMKFVSRTRPRPTGAAPAMVSNMRPDIDAASAGKQDHGDDHAEQAAMKGHAAVPDIENRQRISGVSGEVVEQDVADAPARARRRAPPRGRSHQGRAASIGGALSRQSAHIADEPFAIPPGKQDAGDIADAVPMERQRPELTITGSMFGKARASRVVENWPSMHGSALIWRARRLMHCQARRVNARGFFNRTHAATSCHGQSDRSLT